jgi:hypothetical protein
VALHVGFSGWFQCRLATDPDPFDEPRGVTGWTFAMPGEPDLDRVVRFQPEGATIRPGCDPIAVGVTVDRVALGGELQPDHPLRGAPVRLVRQDGSPPVFEGRNTAVAGDSVEPIVPLSPVVGDGDRAVGRAAEDRYTFPFARLWGRPGLAGVPGAPPPPALIRVATGLDIRRTWRERITALEATTPDTPVERAAIDARLQGLRDGVGFGLFENALMSWAVDLFGPVSVGPAAPLPGAAVTDVPWSWRLWMGGWDADALCGFAVGELTIPIRPGDTAEPSPGWWDRRPAPTRDRPEEAPP